MRLEPLGKAKMPKNPEAKFEDRQSQYVPLLMILVFKVGVELLKPTPLNPPAITLILGGLGLFVAIFLCDFVFDARHRYAIDEGYLFHRFMHSKRKFELATVRRAEIIGEALELEFVSGKIEKFGFGSKSNSVAGRASFLAALEKALPVPLRKETFLKEVVYGLGDNSKSLVLAEWSEKMRLSAGEEVSRFPIKETWSVLFGRKLTPLPITLFILTCVAFPIFTTKQVPAVAYLALLIPLGIATWLVVKKQVPTLDLVIGQDGLGVALGDTFILGEPYRQIKAFTFQASNSHEKKNFYWFQIETAHGTKITEEILVESPSSTKDLFFAKGQLPLREETAEVEHRTAPKPWEAYLPDPNNTPRTK